MERMCVFSIRAVSAACLLAFAFAALGAEPGDNPASATADTNNSFAAVGSLAEPAICDEPAAPLPGSLVICGGGQLPTSVMQRFLELAGGHDARIVIIPTASLLADGPEIEQKLQFWRQANVAAVDVLHTRSRTVADDPNFGKPLAKATGVWFTGGFQLRLTETYLGTLVEKLVRAVLDRGGVIGGTSAGTAIMSTIMIRRGNPELEVGRGFDFLPGTVIDQHFLKRNRQERLLHVLESHPGFVGLGIDEGTAVIAQGRRLSVLGESQVVAYLPSSANRPVKQEVLEAGDEVDLVALSRAAVARAKPRDRGRVPLAVPKGTVVLAGGGDLPREVAERFIKAAGGAGAPIVVVTTAAGEKPTKNDATRRWFEAAGARKVQVIHPRSRSEANSSAVLKELAAARGVWLVGGEPWRLVDTYLGSRAEKQLHALLASGGVVGGTAAGARILADNLLRGSPWEDTEMAAEGYENGFGLLPATAVEDYFSHADRRDSLKRFKEQHPARLGLGIEEQTAALIRGNRLEAIGSRTITVYDDQRSSGGTKAAELTLKAGGSYELCELPASGGKAAAGAR